MRKWITWNLVTPAYQLPALVMMAATMARGHKTDPATALAEGAPGPAA